MGSGKWQALTFGALVYLTSGCQLVAGYEPANLEVDAALDRGVDQALDRGVDQALDRGVDQALDRGDHDQHAEGPMPFDAAPDASAACDDRGRPCSTDSGCDPGSRCLKVGGATLGVCGCSCAPDDPGTPLVNEDSCPPDAICGRAPEDPKSFHCYRRCQPQFGSSGCGVGIACDPSSTVYSGRLDQAVCLKPACTVNSDCPVTTNSKCSQSVPCKAAGQTCSGGICVAPGVCDLGSGLCRPRVLSYTPTAKVGDPCGSDLDCAAAMRCERQRDPNPTLGTVGTSCTSDGECCSGRCRGGQCTPCRTHARGGYCVIVGCVFATLPAFACPPGSVCHRLRPGGWCLKSCKLEQPVTCRGVSGDQAGDYECRAWDQVSFGGVPVAASPVCDFGEAAPCDLIGSVACETLGTPTNVTNMRCRGSDTTTLLPTGSPNGFCFDDTKSGP